MIKQRAECYIVQNGKIICVINNDFQIPGGKMHHHENPEKAAIREVMEEIGIKPKNVSLIDVHNYDDVTKFYSYHADEFIIDKSLLGDGPEGKLNSKWVSLEKALKIFKLQEQYFLDQNRNKKSVMNKQASKIILELIKMQK